MLKDRCSKPTIQDRGSLSLALCSAQDAPKLAASCIILSMEDDVLVKK